MYLVNGIVVFRFSDVLFARSMKIFKASEMRALDNIKMDLGEVG
jgi:hypothetical protein